MRNDLGSMGRVVAHRINHPQPSAVQSLKQRGFDRRGLIQGPTVVSPKLEADVGRDRDPFDRALTALRARLVRSGPLQGAPLLVTPLAAELGVSPTPVREALAWLAGEGVIARRAGGYAAQVHDRRSLARLYELAGLLADAVLAEATPEAAARAHLVVPRGDPLAELSAEPASILDALLARIQAQLAPFRAAEDAVLDSLDRDGIARTVAEISRSDQGWRGLRVQVRRYYRRRARHAGDILGSALSATPV
ncbi:hypothetical protein CA607_08635 [Caulobacter vibrioides]|nr:hypothetical protein CA607_08635 [Caulobacter vibrioides]